MKASFSRSLRARLIIGAAIWIAIGVYAAGIFIAALFRQFATDLVEGELRNDLEELMTLIDVDDDGFPHLPSSAQRPASSAKIGSGFSWQVSRSGQESDQVPFREHGANCRYPTMRSGPTKSQDHAHRHRGDR